MLTTEQLATSRPGYKTAQQHYALLKIYFTN